MQAQKRYIVGLDEGTTSARAVVYDCLENKIVSVSQQNFKQYFPQDGWVEQDAESIYLALTYAYKKAVSQAKIKTDNIISVGLTNQRETVVAFDRETGFPIYNAIVWQCRRTAKDIEALTKAQKTYIKQATGLVADPYFSASKMSWIMKNVPEAQELLKQKRLCLGTIDSYMAFKLTGRFVTDTSNASRTMLYNINTLEWDNKLLKMWGIDKSCLPEIVDSAQIIGPIKEFGGVQLASIIGDQQASLIGNGCLLKGQTKITYGTGGFMLTNAGDQPMNSNDKLLSTIAYTINGKTTYALEGSIFSACSAITWLQRNLRLFDAVEQTENMAFSEKDNGGVYFVPAFTGLGTPFWNANARACFVGINFASNKNHFVRAVLESFGYASKIIVDEMEKSGVNVKLLKVDGGGSKNNFILQFLADILNQEVSRSHSSECTVLGAIYLAGIASGIMKLENVKEIAKQGTIFKNKMDKNQSKELLEKWKKAVEKSDWR